MAFVVACWPCAGVEGRARRLRRRAPRRAAKPAFAARLAEVWAEPQARRFTIFVFVSMLAYSAQDLILEPFAGLVFGMTLGATTKLAGVQHGGVLAGMILVAWSRRSSAGRASARCAAGPSAGCIASAIALVALALGGLVGPAYPLKPAVFALGFANGAFAVAAIGSMMALAGAGANGREGMRMGLWGAAQAIAFGLGGFVGTVAVDIAQGRHRRRRSRPTPPSSSARRSCSSSARSSRAALARSPRARRAVAAPQPGFTTGQGALTS